MRAGLLATEAVEFLTPYPFPYYAMIGKNVSPEKKAQRISAKPLKTMALLERLWFLPRDASRPIILTISISKKLTEPNVYARFGGLCGGPRLGPMLAAVNPR